MPGFLAEAITWPDNYHIRLAVETAIELKLPPTTMLFADKQPSDGWSKEDKKLAMAYTILQRETCGKCGNPVWICRSSNKNLTFSVRTDICYADAALEKKQNDKNWAKNNNKPGQYSYSVPQMLFEEPLPSRDDYLKELNG